MNSTDEFRDVWSINGGYESFTSDYINALLSLFYPIQVGRYPIRILNDPLVSFTSKGWPHLDHQETFQSPRSSFYRSYSHNCYPPYEQFPRMNGSRRRPATDAMSALQLETQKTGGGSDIVGYSLPCIPVESARFRRNRGTEGANTENIDSSEKRMDVWIKEDVKDRWELNKRRPSVIRRTFSSHDKCSSPREAVLTFTQSYGANDDAGNTYKAPQSPQDPKESYESIRYTCTSDDSSTSDASSEGTQNNSLEGSVAQEKFTAHEDELLKKKKVRWNFHCSFCQKGFLWFSHWKAHERVHTGERPYKCQQCPRSFRRADGLQCHLLIHSKERKFECFLCAKRFLKRTSLEKHIFEHTGEKKFTCEYCSEEFSDTEDIETHLSVHEGNKRLSCQYCNRSFINVKRLIRHIRSHTGEKPFKCQSCKMAFCKKSALAVHNRIHSGIKPYVCPECGKAFTISGNLHRHRLIHTGERPYKCSKCGKTFNNPSHLSRHITNKHTPM